MGEITWDEAYVESLKMELARFGREKEHIVNKLSFYQNMGNKLMAELQKSSLEVVHWTIEKIKKEMEEMLEKRENPKVGEIWKNFTGTLVKIVGINTHEGPCNEVHTSVVCTDKDGVMSVIPLNTFMSTLSVSGSPETGFVFWKVSSFYWDREIPVKTPVTAVAEEHAKESIAELSVKAGQVYRHYKGGIYKIKSVDKDSEDPSILRVSYENVKSESYSRPLGMFIETIRNSCGPWDSNPCRIQRFKLVDYTEWEKACNQEEREAKERSELEAKQKEELEAKERSIDEALAAIKVELMAAYNWAISYQSSRRKLAVWQEDTSITIKLERIIKNGSTT